MEEGLPKIPKLDLAQHKFLLMQDLSGKNPQPNRATIKETLLKEIVAESIF